MSAVHTHDPIAFKKHIYNANAQIKAKAHSSGLRPTQIVRQSVVSCPQDSRVYLPNKEAQRQKVKRVRAELKSTNEPRSLDEINIPNNLKYVEGDYFLFFFL